MSGILIGCIHEAVNKRVILNEIFMHFLTNNDAISAFDRKDWKD